MTLSPKHQRFVAEYLKDQCAEQAAIRAGYTVKGARKNAARLRANKGIASAIDAELKRITEAAGLTAQKIREGWRRVIEADPRKLRDANGQLKPFHELGDEEAWFIGGEETVTANLDPTDGKRDPAKVLKLRYVDRAKYLEAAAKHLGMFKDTVEHTGELRMIHELGK